MNNINKKKKYLLTGEVDYVQGYLRYGHYELETELTNEEANDKEFIAQLLKDYGELLIDDYRIEDVGDICSIGLENVDK